MGYVSVPPHNPGNYPPKMGASQEQALGNEKFQQNQALFRRYTSVDGAIKKKISTVVELVFLSPLLEQITGFGQVPELVLIQHLFKR